MLVQGIAGPQQIGLGVPSNLRLGEQGEAITTQLNPRYYEQNFRGNEFFASTQAAIATSVLSATATGFILTNPYGSNKNLVILSAQVGVASLPAGAASLVWCGSALASSAPTTTHTTPLTVRSGMIGYGSVGVGLADSSATLAVTPVVFRAIGGGTAATVAGSTDFTTYIDDLVQGLLVLTPGTVISIQSLTTAVSIVASVFWLELSIV